MKILVTGAAGFIGAAVARKLVSLGNTVVTIDNLSTGYKENIPDGVEFIEGNCQDKKIIEKLDKFKFDAIFHIAGQSSGEISFDNPVYDLQTNAQSTLLLLRLALKANCKKFIYASSMSVYGDHKILPVTERYFLKPKSFYAVGKLASEHYLRIYKNYGITSTSLRLFNVYGPGQNLKNLRQGMLSIFLAMALMDKLINVKGDKNRFRDFVYIDDVVDAFIKSYQRESSGYKVYNVCRKEKLTVEQLLNKLSKNVPYDVEVVYKDTTPGDQFGIFGDNSLIRKDLGWNPKMTFDKGLKIMINWAIEQNKK